MYGYGNQYGNPSASIEHTSSTFSRPTDPTDEPRPGQDIASTGEPIQPKFCNWFLDNVLMIEGTVTTIVGCLYVLTNPSFYEGIKVVVDSFVKVITAVVDLFVKGITAVVDSFVKGIVNVLNFCLNGLGLSH